MKMMKIAIAAATLLVGASAASAQTIDTTASGSVLQRVLGAAAVDAGSLAPNGVLVNLADTLSAVDGSVTASYTSTGSVVNQLDISSATAGITDVGVDGSITATAIDSVSRTVDPIVGSLGDSATTALASVNTGRITAGNNQIVQNAAAGAVSSVSDSIVQLGGSVDTTALIGNLATSVDAVNGGISITADEVNLSAGGAATTALGSVNTGDVVSGVSASLGSTVQGIVALP